MNRDLPIGRAASHQGSESLRTVLIAFAANAVIAVLKTMVAVATGSASIVAEAAHSWADAGNEVFLLIAERRSDKVADPRHPLGYGREAYVWSMIAAFGLFAVGAAVSVIHGITALGKNTADTNYLWAYVVLGGAFVLEGISFLQARGQLRAGAERADMGRLEYLARTSNPTLRAVFFEDAAALVGIVIAATGVALHEITGKAVWDAVGSILVGLLLGVVAVYLLGRNMTFLVGQVADERYTDAVLTWLLERPEVQDVTYLHLEYVGPQKIFVVGAVDLAGNNPENQAATQLETLERALDEDPAVARTVLSLSAPGQTPLRPRTA
ncbi:MAG TPA: cation transporter [Propionibacteriaceae bacterium]|nr:cation transporter [Propionibacteriaceae bacterium]